MANDRLCEPFTVQVRKDKTVLMMGYEIYSGDVAQCANEMVASGLSDARDCKVVACFNPHSYVMAQKDTAFDKSLHSADWLLPDGAGVVLAARWLCLPIRLRVSGPDLFDAVIERLAEVGGSVFFLGATEQTLTRIRARLAVEYPGVVVAGTYSPPFVPEFSKSENAAMIAAINAVKPDILWVGMTAPKQEKWLAEHRAALDVGAAGAVGAVFDFYAGSVKRSPKIFRDIGLEWLPRLVQQPRRLWRRMFVSAPIFLLDVFREGRTNDKVS